MRRKVGQTRRNRAKARSPLAQLPKRSPEGATEESQAAHYSAAALYDPELERYLAGAVAGGKHMGPPPDPADFYDPRLGRIAAAFIAHRRARITFAGTGHLERPDGSFTFFDRYVGLEEVLAELGDPRPPFTAHLAGIFAAEAPITNGADVAKLKELADTRRRLIELEAERAELLERRAR